MSGTPGQILMIDGGGAAAYKTLSGDATLNGAGALALAPSAWVAPALSAGWVNVGSGYVPAGYRKLGDEVLIRGVVKKTSAASGYEMIFPLPVGFRPPSIVVVPTFGSDALARFDIYADGAVRLLFGNPATYIVLTARFSVTA